jgi:pyrimidine-nucleoside phosphorylase
LDKLDAITGFQTNISVEKFRNIIEETGFAMTGQTKEIVPADRLLYALRDVTATVESVPLITASILSKKFAEGSDSLLFDVKWGTGAFMKTFSDAEKLAQSLVQTTKAMGKKSCALITDMNTPLGNKVGNFLEVEEIMDCLEGKIPASDITELTLAFGSWMAILGGKATDFDSGVEMCKKVIDSGEAMNCFLANVKAQGGNVEKLLADRNVRRSPFKREIKAQTSGFITGIDAFKVGIAGVNLGVGRNRTDEAVCADAGIIFTKQKGDFVQKNDIIMEVFGKNEECFDSALPLLESSLSFGAEKPGKMPLIVKEITTL